MYRAKAEGSGYAVFDPALYERAARRLRLRSDLRRAVEREEFVLHYQPIYELGHRGVWGVEALVRWRHPQQGLLGPSEFVALAEDTGLIVPIGRWVLEEACRQMKGWQQSHPRGAALRVIVNFSAKQLRHPGCVGHIGAALRRSRLGAGSLSLDVTESVFIDAFEANTLALRRIEDLGVGLSIDDFGTGYSSLSYLKRLPAKVLKIDKSFVRGIVEDDEDKAIVQMVIDLAHTLGMKVVAEGVESEGQAALLEEMGCDMVQGFHFARPLPPEAVPAILSAR
jgi:EAL domain-containing protein (putative c-di-GMP-specific phosphodiesterase class I)